MAKRARRTGKVKVGVFGGRRGLTMVEILSAHPDARIVAVCDRDKGVLQRCRAGARAAGSKVGCYLDFESFLKHDFDAVVLANYATEHAPFAVRALDSGRHVLSEVLAVQTLSEAVRLVEAVKRSGRVYAYAENYCYFRATQEMRRLYRKGDLGEFQHGEGEYVHDCESVWPEITYGDPQHWRNRMYSTFYCTHSLGPIINITGTRPVRVVGFETPNVGAHLGALGGASAMILCQMSNGATVKSLHSTALKREPPSIWYCIYGTKGSVESDRWGESFNAVNLFLKEDPSTPYARHYVPRWPFESELSDSIAGHGGGDFWEVHFFLEKILGRPLGRESIDVYTALDMTVPGILAYRSILDGNHPYTVPDFRKKRDREKCRDDNFSVDPEIAGEHAAPPSSFGTPEVPPSVYRRQRRLYREFLKRP